MKKLLILLILFSSCVAPKKIHKYPIIRHVSKNHILIIDSLGIQEDILHY
jgi:hypothetical protein